MNGNKMNDYYIKTTITEGSAKSIIKVPQNTSLAEYLLWISSFSKHSIDDFPKREGIASKAPFLSVLIRTQGTRIQELNETFLCLAAQTNSDFEVILLGHNVKEDYRGGLERLIEDQPMALKNKIHFVPVEGGTRTKPLNVGVSVAAGKYFSILDDDDLVFDNWVEEFCNIANQDTNDGKILHCYSLTQKWDTHNQEGTKPQDRALRANGSPDAAYCRMFNPAEELFLNHAPTLSLAFPTFIANMMNIHFNEELTTTEDWDFLLKCYFICGISESEIPTSIYRLWDNAKSSRTAHTRDEWVENYAKISEYYDSIPLLFGTGSRTALQSQNSSIGTEFTDTNLRDTCALYYDTSATSSVVHENRFPEPALEKTSTLLFSGKNLPPMKELTFKPTNRGYLTMFAFDMEIIDVEGNETKYDFSNVKTNGQQVDSWHVLFLQRSPEIYVTFDRPTKIDSIRIFLRAEPGAAAHHLDQAMKGKLALWGGRAKRWILRRLGLGD